MNGEIESYVQQVMRRVGLSRREKLDWMEEMSGHIQDEVMSLVASGHGESEATSLALQKFGDPSFLRKKIAREIFGLPAFTIYSLAMGFLIMFIINIYVLSSHLPTSWYSRYPTAWGYITEIISGVLLSPSLMLALCLSFLLMFKTRCRKDRAGIVSTLAVYGALWTAIRLPVSPGINNFVFGIRNLTVGEPWVLLISLMLITWGLLLYLWTNNKWDGLAPTLISILAGVWSPLLLHDYSMSVFYTAVLVRCIPIAFLLLVFKVLDKYLYNRDSLTMV